MTVRGLDSEAVIVPGPEGPLEAVLERARERPAALAVVCHPHPLHGGTMRNKVVHTLARSYGRLGARALRFNFRGVGTSAGSYANGEGEVDDALAAIEWLRAERRGCPCYLAGFSFGANVAARAAARTDCAGLVTVAPPVARLPAGFERPACPWLVVQGDDDDIVEAEVVSRWAAGLDEPPDVEIVPGAGHFFHGRLSELGRVVEAYFADTPLAAGGSSC